MQSGWKYTSLGFLAAQLLFCGQQVVEQQVDGGVGSRADGSSSIGTADAASAGGDSGSCCGTPVPVFTKLAEGDLSGEPTEPISVSGYAEIIVYTTTRSCFGYPRFRPDPSVDFAYTNQDFPPLKRYKDTYYYGGRLRVDGAELQLSGGGISPCHYVVAGIRYE